MASSNRRKPTKARRLNVVIRRLARVELASVSFAIPAKISVGIGFLFWTGLTQILFIPSCTIGLDVRGGRPARPWTQDIAFIAASAAETDSR